MVLFFGLTKCEIVGFLEISIDFFWMDFEK